MYDVKLRRLILRKLSVTNGIDNIGKYSNILKGSRLGLITNQTGVDKAFRTTIDILRGQYSLSALYSPEHGLRGCLEAGAAVGSYVDEPTGLPVYSLYCDNKRPSAQMLEDVDTLVFDIQDIGSRYYTFIYTMALSMECCAELGKTFAVLDRINPVGNATEGNIPEPAFRSFVGLYPIPVRHGMTVGELAGLMNNEYGIGARLEVVKAEGWKRDAFFNETDLHWINPTPNIPSPDAALLYAGTCLFEGTNISEGRGTTRPFELIGAPWIEPVDLAAEMNGLGLEGIYFRPAYFRPVYSKYRENVCGGVQLHIVDRMRLKPFQCGIRLLFKIREMYWEHFSWNPSEKDGGAFPIDLLAGTDRLRLARDSREAEALLEAWESDCAGFGKVREKYLLYD